MIPADLAARLRFLNEASFFNTEPPVAGLQRAREIQSQLPELVPGQRFFALLQRTLPDGSFQALVAGKQITLALNTSAKAGDTLELVVTGQTPKAILARLASPEGAQQANSAPSTLSQTGKLISFVLTGQPPARPVTLAANQPLLNAPPTSAAPLVPMLRQALAQSGLFYESHQAQWLSGKIDVATLLREPQAQPQPSQQGQGAASQAAATQTAQATVRAALLESGAASTQTAAPTNRANPATGAGQLPDIDGTDTIRSTTAIDTNSPRPAAIAERTLPLVHQQLDALATQQYVLHGVAWPGQKFEWIIEDNDSNREGGEHTSSEEWNSTLRIELPRLGGMEAIVHLTAAGVALRLKTDHAATAEALEAGRSSLEAALAASDIALTGMAVEMREARNESNEP